MQSVFLWFYFNGNCISRSEREKEKEREKELHFDDLLAPGYAAAVFRGNSLDESARKRRFSKY